MIIDGIESQGLQVGQFDLAERLRGLNREIKTTMKPIDGCYQRIDSSVDIRISKMLGIDNVSAVESLHSTIMDATKDMLQGIERGGYKTMGLEDLKKWKLDPASEFYDINLKQQSGFAAEIISTYKENLAAKARGLDLATYRTDDLPILFPQKKFKLNNGKEWTPKRNDQFVDKVRLNKAGEVVERIQTKFVGDNGKEWLEKMTSKKFEKYLDGDIVDKLECPKDYYNDIKAEIPKKMSKLEQQLERVKADGKPSEVVEGIQHKIDKLNKIDEMVEQSNTTRNEAKFARLHPRTAAAKAFIPEVAKLSNKEGFASAGLTFTVSTVDNISAYMDNEITAEEMVKDILKETAAAGALGYGTTFISTATAQAMSKSSSAFIQRVGGSCLPAATVSFAVESYDSISEFAQGKIDGAELAFDLGDNAAGISGGIAGAKVGATVGTLAGPAGTVAGTLVGGIVGCVVASEAYATAVEAGAEGAELLADKAGAFAQNTIDTVKDVIPEKVSDVADAFQDFISSNKLPIQIYI